MSESNLMFKKPYIFIIELIVVALVVGWMLYSFPDIVGRYIPFLVLVVVWHLSWEIVKHDSVKALLLSSPVARWNRMFVYGLIFIAGGLLSILYWWGITKGLSELATAENAFRVTHEHKATTEAQPQPMVPADHSPDKNQQGEIEKEILAKLDAIQKSVGPKPGNPFSMFVGPTFIAIGKDTSTPLWIVCDTMYGRTASPVKLAVFVGLINRQPFATIIESYKAEAHNSKGEWITFATIDTITSEIWMGYPYGRSVNKSKFFDRLIYSHTLKSADTVIGWMLFDYPIGWEAPGADLRITVTDISGVSSSVSVIRNPSEKQQGGNLFVEYGTSLDLSRLRLKDYSERWKN